MTCSTIIPLNSPEGMALQPRYGWERKTHGKIDVEASEETSGQVEQPITFYLGTTYPLILTLIDEDGDPYDLASGESLILTVAATVSGTAVITKTVSANDGTSGEYAFEFAASDTSELSAGMYTYKIMLTSSTLNLPIVIPSPFELLAI